MIFLIVNIILVLVILFLFVILSMVWPPDSPWSPWWRTNSVTAQAMWKLAKVTKKDVIYELGSGDGISLITAAKKFGARCVGIEIDPLRFFVSKFFIWRFNVGKQVKVTRKNFFAVSIAPATVVYMYLVPRALERLKPKVLKELKPGTRVISYVYEIPYLPLSKHDKKQQIFLYTIPQKSRTRKKA